MSYKTILISLLASFLVIACASESGDATQTPTKSAKAEKTKVSSGDTDPCNFIRIEQLAEILELDAAQLSTTSEEFADNFICTFLTTEIAAEAGDVPESIAQIVLRPNKEGKYDFENALSYQLERGELKVPAGPDKDKMVPLKKIDDLGSKAVGHVAAHYATIIFHENNEFRISITLYRKVPNNLIFNGLHLSQEESLNKLEKLAKALAY